MSDAWLNPRPLFQTERGSSRAGKFRDRPSPDFEGNNSQRVTALPKPDLLVSAQKLKFACECMLKQGNTNEQSDRA